MHTDDGFFLHSEQKRRLGPLSLLAIALSLCLPLSVFVIVPYSLASLAGPSTLVGVIMATVILMISVLHSCEMSSSVPRSWSSLHVAYASLGSLPAACIGTLELIDSLALAAILGKATAAHTNVLFGNFFRTHLEVHVGPQTAVARWLLDADFDLTAMFGLLFAYAIISCSLRVVGTVSFCLLLLSTLVITSCALVAFFHADPVNWVEAPFFAQGMQGLLQSTCALLAGLRVPSLIVSLLDDTWSPRRRAPYLLPLLSFFSALFAFLITLTFSLCVNVSRISELLLLPNVFHTLQIPVARYYHAFARMRYMLTVASVCGLWSALLCSLLPGGRLLLTISSLRLLPLGIINASQQRSLCLFFILLLASLFVKNEHLLSLLSLTTPASLLITASLTLCQRYGARTVGLTQEPSKYKRVKDRTETSDVTREISQQSISSFASTRRHSSDSDGDSDYESLPLQSGAGPFSVSSYNAVAASERYNFSGRHNCLAHACDGEGNHVYQNEVPELPYYGAYDGGVRRSRSDAFEQCDSGPSAAAWYTVHVGLSAAAALLIRRPTDIPLFLSIPLLFALLVLLFPVARAMAKLPQNASAWSRSHRVTVFPYSTLFLSFLLVMALSSHALETFALAAAPICFGLAVHLLTAVFSKPSSVQAPLVIANPTAINRQQREEEEQAVIHESSLSIDD